MSGMNIAEEWGTHFKDFNRVALGFLTESENYLLFTTDPFSRNILI